jgi:hypothetical protein
MVASEWALKSVISKAKGTRRGIGSMGKRMVDGWHFIQSSSKHGRASNGDMTMLGAVAVVLSTRGRGQQLSGSVCWLLGRRLKVAGSA